jgi:hypothetical protein
MEIEKEVKSIVPDFTKEVQKAGTISNNEAELRTKITPLIENFSRKVNLNLHFREEYTLVNVPADAVYNRLLTGYESLRSLLPNNN